MPPSPPRGWLHLPFAGLGRCEFCGSDQADLRSLTSTRPCGPEASATAPERAIRSQGKGWNTSLLSATTSPDEIRGTLRDIRTTEDLRRRSLGNVGQALKSRTGTLVK